MLMAHSCAVDVGLPAAVDRVASTAPAADDLDAYVELGRDLLQLLIYVGLWGWFGRDRFLLGRFGLAVRVVRIFSVR